MKPLLMLAFVMTVFAARAEASDAAGRLMTVGQFAFGGVGFAGVTSAGEKVYREVLARPTAEVDFENIFQKGNAQAKAYALAGLFQLNRAKFAELSGAFRRQAVKVSTMRGCIIMSQTSASVVAEIATGIYSGTK